MNEIVNRFLNYKREELKLENYTEEVGEVCGGAENCKKLSSANIVKNTGTMDYSEYLKTKFMKKHCLPPPNSKAPVPTPIQGPCSSSLTDGTENGTEKGIC